MSRVAAAASPRAPRKHETASPREAPFYELLKSPSRSPGCPASSRVAAAASPRAPRKARKPRVARRANAADSNSERTSTASPRLVCCSVQARGRWRCLDLRDGGTLGRAVTQNSERTSTASPRLAWCSVQLCRAGACPDSRDGAVRGPAVAQTPSVSFTASPLMR